jgi:sugar/nucleoside kinase (ribokinase family)
VIGEALVDLVPDRATGEYRATPGGSPFNVAIGLARLGNRTSLMARLADDEYGRLLLSTAAAEGIDLSAAPRVAERASVATASVDAAARARYEFDPTSGRRCSGAGKGTRAGRAERASRARRQGESRGPRMAVPRSRRG